MREWTLATRCVRARARVHAHACEQPRPQPLHACPALPHHVQVADAGDLSASILQSLGGKAAGGVADGQAPPPEAGGPQVVVMYVGSQVRGGAAGGAMQHNDHTLPLVE